MTKGADIIAAIILLALAVAIIVYLLHWLYRRSSKEVSFVRTGMLGEKVVISGGAFVLPIIHNITQVGMRTLSINIKRAGEKSLITKDPAPIRVCLPTLILLIISTEILISAKSSIKVNPPVVKLGNILT